MLTSTTSAEPDPIRGEIFGSTQLAEHAYELAHQHTVAPVERHRWFARRDRGPLLSRLADTEKVLLSARDTLLGSVAAGIEVSPAGAWLLDNFFVVLEQVPEIKAAMPPGFYRELPKLVGEGPYAGYPRAYAIVVEMISHTEGRLDETTVSLMIEQYQRLAPLTLGELWAIPALLRMGYLENIRRMARRAAHDAEQRALADTWVGLVLGTKDTSDAGPALSRFVYDGPVLTPAFLTRFIQQIRSRRSDFTPLLWLEQWMADTGITVEEAAERSSQELALGQLVMANSIASLRSVVSIDWTAFVEKASAMEGILREDPSGAYPLMTRATRDRYRHVVERIAKDTGRAETDVARGVVSAATEAKGALGTEAREAHIGYYLIGEGSHAFAGAAGYRGTWRTRLTAAVCAHPGAFYVGTLAIALLVALAAFASPLSDATTHVGPGWWIAALALVFLPAMDAAVALVHQLVPLLVSPSRLARLDYEHGIAPRDRTAVVVPVIVGNVDAVAQALDHLEVQYLANRDPEVRFAILSDLTDADGETTPADAEIVAALVEGVRTLNASYVADAASERPFYLLHRNRQYNEVDRMWMGWERKRGKLTDFNAFVLGGEPRFAVMEGDLPWLAGVRYVITLDSDTVLPQGGAASLVGTMAHPLNRAEYDETRGQVVRGYGILQPRVSVSLASASESRFAAVYAGHPGIDPYTTAVSDVYQDVFGEGTFTGKGIYDVAIFSRATDTRFPQNALLSHDLIEGAFARAGLVTDVEVFDDYPTRYLTARRRTHRWIRGDWQLLPWLPRRIPGSAGRTRNPLSRLSRWKIADNMRRSLNPIALMGWLVAGWFVLPGSRLDWMVTAVSALALPWLIPLLFAAARPPLGQSWRAYYAGLGHDSMRAAQQFVIALMLLPDHVLLAADAISRTLARVFVTHTHMLEWQTASQAERSIGHGRREVWQRMWPSSLLGAAVSGFAVWRAAASPSATTHPAELILSATLMAVWILAPEFASALSAPLARRDLVLLTHEQRASLRYALRHWRYFERFVTAETNWLVPDNFQETPEPIVAPRTSPTNIGLQLLSTMSAYDLGFLTRSEMLTRLERTMEAIEKLPKVDGHLFNWYDIRDARVLDPPYVSTVDSGNFAGHLIALSQGCLESLDEPLDDARLWRVLAAESVDLAHEAPRSDASWVGERILRYERSVLELRRSGAGTASVEGKAELLWARQRLEAAALELVSLGLDPEHRADLSLRDAAAAAPAAAALVQRLEAMANRARLLAMQMDFRLLYSNRRRLFAIGYDARSGKLDESSYDLLASEARLTSFVAIAKGDAPVEHWFRLGRSLTVAEGAPALVSWSGTMFEYLMPLLVMPPRPFSLLDQTCHSAVHRQISYGKERGVPWGMSESAYNVRDRHETYQYRAFGVPDLALKRGLVNDVIVAPYATALATAVDVHDAMDNFVELEGLGALGRFGFYDALDFTRPDEGSSVAVVKTYMAHHVGMSLVALDNAISRTSAEPDGIWQRRFMLDAAVRATALLLDERVPRRYVPRPSQEDVVAPPTFSHEHGQIHVHEVSTPDTPEPHVAILGGSGYNVLLTNAGSGRSRSGENDVFRWRADATRDNTGHWIYVKDVTTGSLWSAAHQPVRASSSVYRATFASDRVEFTRRDGAIETHTEIVVIGSEQAEIRRVTLVNRSSVVHDIELTSYAEVVLCPAAADRAHPAFQKLFVETEWVPGATLLASRRPRSNSESWPWCAHVVAAGREQIGEISYETDRARFLGRGRTAQMPQALDTAGALNGTAGAPLDPIVSLRVRVRVEPGRSATVAFTTAIAATRTNAVQLADRYRDVASAARAMKLARTEAQVELRDFDIAPSDVALYQELAGALIYPHEALRAAESERAAMTRGQAALWSQGISGDWPIMLATIRTSAGLASIRQLLIAHRYWRTKGVRSDLVILNAEQYSYTQQLQDQLVMRAMASSEGGGLEQPGGVFIRRADQLSPDDIALLRATARVHVICDGVGLGDIVAANIQAHGTPHAPEHRSSQLPLVARPALGPATDTPGAPEDNVYGRMQPDGGFRIDVAGSQVPPAPWSNVIANPSIGFCVTERGGGYTWAKNSYFYRLTPWFNDPVADPAGEVVYLKDLDTGEVWTPTPAPFAAAGDPRQSPAYDVRHAPGITRFAHRRAGISTELTLAVAPTDTVKITRLRVTNGGRSARRLSLTSYVEWVLGVDRESTRHYLQTRYHDGTGAILAQNHYSPDFDAMVAFSWMSEAPASHTGRRDQFIGRNGDLRTAAALLDDQLSGAVGAGYDPCAALRADLTLAPGESRDIVFLLGAAPTEAGALELIAKHGAPAAADASVNQTLADWSRRLSVIRVKTPEPAFDSLFNEWSLYQALACRMWARSALYQSSGAYGFRDQLQDCMAFVHAEPAVVREHLLRAAGRQFREGDVQHWWHEPSGTGVRTRFSDDLAWLPFVADHYVTVTGDTGVWDATAPFLEMRLLKDGEQEAYEHPSVSLETGSLYEHCVRALNRACTKGSRGLPLMGAGDWNDGMNHVGAGGHGESVWLAWFLIAALRKFSVHCTLRGDTASAARFTAAAEEYARAVEASAWDGHWYIRAFYDDGTPLGSAANDECRIDAIAQSWSVLSGAGDPVRTREAMKSVNEFLVRDDQQLVLLLTPPFDTTTHDPGYIKGYLPGVRENGAQYTHAAMWTALAMARLGDGDRAGALMRMLNPYSHTRTTQDSDRYKVEPYVVPADVYAAKGHEGRGGWTWYTGSASWCYRVALEGILGVERRGSTLRIDPSMPSTWPAVSVTYRFGNTDYAIDIRNPSGVSHGVRSITDNDVTAVGNVVALVDDGKPHRVVVLMG